MGKLCLEAALYRICYVNKYSDLCVLYLNFPFLKKIIAKRVL